FERHAAAWEDLWRGWGGGGAGGEHARPLLRPPIAPVLPGCSPDTPDLAAGAAPPRRHRGGLLRRGVLGGASAVSFLPCPAARGHARVADVPLPPHRRSPGGGPGAGIPGRDVPVAERKRGDGGDPARPPEPGLRLLGA